jgi:DNA-binding NarL/FixJ family response regulator
VLRPVAQLGALSEARWSARAAHDPITIAIAEDSYLIRESLVHMLGGHGSVEIVAVCSDPDTLELAIERESPRVLVTETHMLRSTRPEGIDLAARLRRTHPEVGVLVLTSAPDLALVEQLFDGGASGRGYLLKHKIRHSGELIDAIEAVVRGESVMDPEIVGRLVRTNTQTEDSPLTKLTARERELLALVAQGQSNGAIAESLVVTKRAVEKHLNSIFSKLGLPASESERLSRRVKAALIFVAEQAQP